MNGKTHYMILGVRPRRRLSQTARPAPPRTRRTEPGNNRPEFFLCQVTQHSPGRRACRGWGWYRHRDIRLPSRRLPWSPHFLPIDNREAVDTFASLQGILRRRRWP
jgi:hypothetical protein